ncbi:hypothetical protein ACFC1R_29150 [Kitasatospora sp. NPDC056138]|uniref:hypothetical protein n=1 Tax=Kitasatospora sp. NPDC056138 TaxID=3345724 RepID=UPI0035D9F424
MRPVSDVTANEETGRPAAVPPSGRATALRLAGACAGATPAVVLRLAGVHPAAVVGMVVFGLGVLAAALLLMWAAETAREDIAGPLALALLAFIAVLPLVERQVDEVMLTAAQTLLAVVLLLDLRFLPWKAGLLFGLFAVQFVLPGENARLLLGYVYLALALALLTRRWRELPATARAVGGRIEGDPH